MTEILGVGVAVLDIVNFTAVYPGPDDEIRATDQHRRSGGNAANTLGVLSQFGHHCRLLAALGDDDGAEFIRADLGAKGIAVESAGAMKGVTPTSYITVAKDTASRSIVHYRRLPELSFEQFCQVDLRSVDFCHFEGRHPQETAKMLTYLQTHYPRLPFSLEIEKPRPDIQLLGHGAEIVFYSRHYVQAMGYTNAVDFLRGYDAFAPRAGIVCTWGDQGCYYRHAKNSRQIEHVPAHDLSPVIDSVGAGDTFIAGFLHTWWQTRDINQSAQFANRLAAKKCAQVGFQGLAE